MIYILNIAIIINFRAHINKTAAKHYCSKRMLEQYVVCRHSFLRFLWTYVTTRNFFHLVLLCHTRIRFSTSGDAPRGGKVVYIPKRTASHPSAVALASSSSLVVVHHPQQTDPAVLTTTGESGFVDLYEVVRRTNHLTTLRNNCSADLIEPICYRVHSPINSATIRRDIIIRNKLVD